jgi:Tol biopolymer transport system component
MKINYVFTVLIWLSAGLHLDAQAQDRKKAFQLFEAGNFEQALDEYLELIDKDPDNIEYNYNIAVSYLNTNIDKSKAIPYLEKLVENPKINADAYYLLGRAYHYGYKFNEAISAYQKFISLGKGSEANKADVQKQIEYCQNAKELMKFPKNVTFINLGPNINSKYADYYPFIPVNEGYVIFNSNRPESKSEVMENGSYPANVYISYEKNGQFQKGQLLPGKINTGAGSQEVVGLTADGKYAIFYFEDFNQVGDLYGSKVDGNSFTEPVKLSAEINSKYHEIAACITDDNEKLFFASDRPGGYGGVDIYLCQRLPNGNWSTPQNLGPTINTEFDEDFPNISPDGKTLFFSSRGHASMGGYDIFRATWDENKRKFTGVQNLGYPINTPEDNMNFRISENGKFGYVSALRAGGYGDLDIYRVNFNEIEPKYTVISGVVKAADGKKFEDVFIQVTDSETDEVYGDYIPNQLTNRYVIILPPGKYNMFVGAIGYGEQYFELDILDKTSFKAFIDMDVDMKPE